MRERIVDAAERILIEKGARAATTRAVATAARCAEGTLYVHFADRVAIFAAVFEKRWPIAAQALSKLEASAGQGDVVGNLSDCLQSVMTFLMSLEPIVAAIKSDPLICDALQGVWREMGAGPQEIVRSIGAYIAAEQAGGRARTRLDAEIAAEVLVGFVVLAATKAKFAAGEAGLDCGSLRQVIVTNVERASV